MMKLWHMNTVCVMEVPRNELNDDISARSLKEINDDIPAPPAEIFRSKKRFNLRIQQLEALLRPLSLNIANLFLSSLSGDLDLDLDLERESSLRFELPLSLRSLLSLKGAGM